MNQDDRVAVRRGVVANAETLLGGVEERWEDVPRIGPIEVSQFPGHKKSFPESAAAFFEDFYPCAAGAAITDDSGRLLCIYNPDRDEWETPGGVVDPGEIPAETARRETYEESGIECELTGVLFTRLMEITYDVPETLPVPIVVFTGKRVGGSELDGAELTNNDEVTEVTWFSPDELPSDLRAYEQKHAHLVSLSEQ